MFGIGMPELLLILAVALIVIGPKKLPDLARSLGKAMGEFKKAASDLKDSLQIDTEVNTLKSAFDHRSGKRANGTDSKPPDTPPAVDDSDAPVQERNDPARNASSTDEDRRRTADTAAVGDASHAGDAHATGSDSAASDTHKGH